LKVDINTIHENPHNPRTITEDKFRKLVKSLKEFPEMLEARPIVVDKDNIVLGGNMRLKAAREAGLTEVPIYRSEWSHDKSSEFVIKDNVGFGEWDWDLLANEWDAYPLAEWGLDVWTPEEEVEGLTDPDEVPEVPADPITQPGDLWILGDHRLLCGDSTKAEDVKKLMNGEKADMVFTSPPYNSGGNSGTGGYRGNKKRKTKDFYNQCSDNWTSDEYREFLWNVLNQCAECVTEEAPVLWNVMYNANSRDDYGYIVFSERHPFKVQETIVWDKSVGMNITGSGILSRSAELIFLMAKDKYYTNQNMEVFWNVWRISNKGGGNMQHGHGASFPEGLPNEAISKFCKIRGLIYEPFLGSGTTLIAAEKTGRKCYGMELDPKYCDVIVKRWEDFTGQKASKANA